MRRSDKRAGQITSASPRIAALAGAPVGTQLAVVSGPTGPAWLPVAVFFGQPRATGPAGTPRTPREPGWGSLTRKGP
jgi:hypothetical protein